MKWKLYLKRCFTLLVALFITGSAVWAQSKTVTGVVTDANGLPLVGVSVLLQGSTAGVSTGINGTYSISVPGPQSVLVYNYLGYNDHQETVGAKSVIDVIMNENAQELDELVVIGYGAVRKRDLTGTVQSIKNEDITLAPVGNVMQALQGRVAGLDITRSSGKSGSDVNMTLRGSRSINGDNTPLFIIDGVPGNYSDLNPNDVESIEVLKDASSAAIYGSAGANGIVIITTKNAKKGGKLTVNFDAYYGINGFLEFPPVRTGDDYIELRRQAYIGGPSGKEPSDPSILFSNAEWNAVQNNQWVDWFDLGTRNGTLQNYSVSMSGGNDRTSGYFSANYFQEQGILYNDQNTRYSFKATVDHQIRPWLDGGINVISSFTDRDERRGQYFTRVLCLLPLGTPFNEDGSINPFPLAGDSQLSPIADMADGQYVNNYHILSVNPTVYLEAKPVKGLSLKTLFSGDLQFSRQGMYKGTQSSEGYSLGKSSAEIINENHYNYKWENIITYNTTFAEDHNLTLTGVTSWSKYQREESGMRGYNVAPEYSFHNLGVSDATSRVTSSEYVGSQSMAFIGRINYSYKGRYLVSLSNRYEGSSILAQDHNWDNFPAAAIGWRISDENFMKGATKIDNLKLRASYGVTGNAGADPYATQTIGRAGTNLAFQETPAAYYMFGSEIGNLLLSWEKSYGANIGVDLNMFRNRLNVSVDMYNVDTKDILFKRTLPASTGGSNTSAFSIWENVCETNNRGIEVVLNSVNIQKKDFTWSTTLTFSSNHEEITSFTSNAPIQNGDSYLVKGYPLKSYYSYKYAGIFQTNDEAKPFSRKAGDVRIEEVVVDQNYNENDRQVLGSPTPKWMAGLSNTLLWKGIDLTFFFDARWGQMMNYGILGWYNPTGGGNGPAIIDYWTPENPSGRFPRPGSDRGSFAQLPVGSNSVTYIDGSYIKLRNITLGYTLPQSVVGKVGLSRLRVYGTASDPWIYTESKYLKNYDPERGGADEFPLAKQLVFGVNITF